MFAGLSNDDPVRANWDALELIAELLTERASAAEAIANPRLTAVLSQPDAVESLAECALGGEVMSAGGLVEVLDLLPPLPRHAAAGAAFLRGRIAECAENHDAMRAAVHAALTLDPDHTPALCDAAWFAPDEGHLREAHRMLVAARLDDDEPSRRILAGLMRPGPQCTGRNEPCPCGSGKKYKSCCIDLNGHDLSARLELLRHKAVAFAQRPPQRQELLRVAAAFAGTSGADDDRSTELVLVAACDPVVIQLALFEGGLLQRFVDLRGPLLPADELATAARWASCRHRTFTAEVDADGLRLRADDADVRLGPLSWPDGATHALAVLDEKSADGSSIVTSPVPLRADDAATLAAACTARPSVVQFAAEVGRAVGPITRANWHAA